jgi:hypothetical protein
MRGARLQIQLEASSGGKREDSWRGPRCGERELSRTKSLEERRVCSVCIAAATAWASVPQWRLDTILLLVIDCRVRRSVRHACQVSMSMRACESMGGSCVCVCARARAHARTRSHECMHLIIIILILNNNFGHCLIHPDVAARTRTHVSAKSLVLQSRTSINL